MRKLIKWIKSLFKKQPRNPTIETKRLAYRRNRGRCFYCDKQVTKSEGHFDHFYPYSKGGKNDIGNIVWSCAHCNLSKSNHRLDVWLRRLPKSQALKINKVLKHREIR